jgi:hypothetical protein
MNIFVLDYNPQKCAKYHVDKHVVKMILETAQLLCGVHHMCDQVTVDIPYKLSHKNHPCSIWVRECVENYVWLCDLGIELCKEYTYRYGKRHKSQDVIEWCMLNIPPINQYGDITTFPLAMPNECKLDDVVESYRNYYILHKKGFAKWTKRNTPKWFTSVDDSLEHHQVLLREP